MKERIKYWIIADTHFGHARMVEPDVGRHFNFSEMILENIGKCVRDSDILIHLGDICIGNDLLWHEKLRAVCHGKMWLIRGNHDKKTTTWYLEHGWDVVVNRIDMDIYGKHVALTHKPINDDDFFDMNIHGHMHKTMHHEPYRTISDKHRLVYCEDIYGPLSLRTICEETL